MKWHLWLNMLAISTQLIALPAIAETAPTTPITLPQTIAASIESNHNIINKTYTFLQINGLDGFSLKGSNAVRDFYLPILRDWTLDSVTMHLIISKAAFLEKPTTLTLSANNHPIDSIELSGMATNKTWDVTLPATLVKNGIISLTFSSIVNEKGFYCYNLINPAYWVYVSGDSTVTYHYNDHDYFPDLSKLPYPFIHDPSLTKDNVTIVLPDSPSLKTMSAAFNVANMLGNKATWRGVKINAITTKMLGAIQKSDQNMIFVGTGSQLQLNKININFPLPIDKDGAVLDKNNQKIKNNIGIIMLTPSPYNKRSALLTVTGNSEEGVINAALMLRQPDFVNSILYNRQALVLNKPNIITNQPHWNDITLKMLGYGNQTVYGSPSDSLIDYTIDLPQDKKIKKIKLSVDYTVSAFLKNYDPPYLTIRINGTPVAGNVLHAGDGNIKTWNLDIDGSNLLPGKNIITFDFSIRMGKLNCDPQTMNLAWVTLYSSTKLHVDSDKRSNFIEFQQFNTTSKNLAIIIPSKQSFFSSIEFINKILELGKLMQKIGYVDFYDIDSISQGKLINYDILYIGDINNNKLLQNYIQSIPFYFANNGLYISPDLIPVLSISSEVPSAITELLPSSFNTKNLMMLISAQSNTGYLQGMDLLTDYKKIGIIKGNVALAYNNGTFNSIQSQKLALLSTNRMRIRHVANILYYVAGGLVFLGLCSLLFIVIRRKIKYYFSKNHD